MHGQGGISWRITPRVLTETIAEGGAEAKRVFDVMIGHEEDYVARL